ncbi:hypothetical protein ARMSODRAFT_974669 [Armillaria solidipes]|uniref:Uncharacterized protein n=1 Tax=Armillaria solidipes TaxID=1076256 RepID=A0A2H3BH89_9AGAR|nr:hypothetical protein ARMSODRAFT_974669 [Armillaria solidipes]
MLVLNQGGSSGAVGAGVLIILASSVMYTPGESTYRIVSSSVRPLDVSVPTFVASSCSYPSSPLRIPATSSLSHSPGIPSDVPLHHPGTILVIPVIVAVVVLSIIVVVVEIAFWALPHSKMGSDVESPVIYHATNAPKFRAQQRLRPMPMAGRAGMGVILVDGGHKWSLSGGHVWCYLALWPVHGAGGEMVTIWGLLGPPDASKHTNSMY